MPANYGLTPPISGSRPWTFHTARFYRESAALLSSAYGLLPPQLIPWWSGLCFAGVSI